MSHIGFEKEFAEELLTWFQTESPSIFNLNHTHAKDISLDAQRRRAINCAWSLYKTKRTDDKSVVAVIGAGFSGLVFATTLSLLSGCSVIIFEKGKALNRHRESFFRFISPALNVSNTDRQVRESYDKFNTEYFPYRPNQTFKIAEKWFREFDLLTRNLQVLTLKTLK
ncbi:NAD(P)/FAD-dependent oxidoreductase [Rhodobacteraceae bacterium M382]|nr:NAD(P)/FAD-dependent oxidoreductase [Rhodobacteraceae bacterium M382]